MTYSPATEQDIYDYCIEDKKYNIYFVLGLFYILPNVFFHYRDLIGMIKEERLLMIMITVFMVNGYEINEIDSVIFC